MRNHGPFTVGPTARAAVKAAMMCAKRYAADQAIYWSG
jgi:ribulose-5-phosphate 4-epimerase/fuculose-1-phosphate aldolase